MMERRAFLVGRMAHPAASSCADCGDHDGGNHGLSDIEVRAKAR
jgi:hypothetical protein